MTRCWACVYALSNATLMLADGVPIGAVSMRLGHAKTSITIDDYAHVTIEMQERATESIGAALFG